MSRFLWSKCLFQFVFYSRFTVVFVYNMLLYWLQPVYNV